jgi:BirA family biotin operon repressor/biotin-[acetyl-CoA-carboxylase] ligase
LNFSIPTTRYLGKRIFYYSTCDSTNRQAQQLLREGKGTPGALVYADHQTAGRGQQGSDWEAAPSQNITVSLILFPALTVEKQHWLTIVASLSVHDAISSWLSKPPTIKWPNDILCESSKICGILIQNNLKGRKIHSSVIGIGLNVNQTKFAVPGATSLALLTGQRWNRQEVLARWAACAERRLAQLEQQEFSMLSDDYLAHLHWRGKRHLFEDAEGQFYGTIEGIDKRGQLTVKTEGQTRYYDVKQLKYVR